MSLKSKYLCLSDMCYKIAQIGESAVNNNTNK